VTTPDRPAVISLSLIAYRMRVYLLCIGVLASMACLAPNFVTAPNASTMFQKTSTSIYAAIGFTVVLLSGQLDLSIGTTMTLGGMIAVGLHPRLGWPASFAIAGLAGVAVGLFNGLLVTKARVNSFIVTLGTMTILPGIINILCNGGTIAVPVKDSAFADALDPVGWLVTPRVVLSLIVLAAFAIFLGRTRAGRGFFLTGANPQTAWYSGLSVTRYVIAAFVISGALCALGGAVSAVSLSSATPTLGDTSLMLVIAAVIIGGASMRGGSGSVIKSAVALFTLVALVNGLSCMGAGFEMQLIASGAVLASVVFYDAYRAAQQDKIRGQRKELLDELSGISADQTQRSTDMPESKDRNFALACMTIVACVAIVAIYALATRNAAVPTVPASVAITPPAAAPAATGVATSTTGNPPSSASSPPAVDISALKATDGQPLIAMDDAPLATPARPADPSVLPEDDALHWYDLEYSGRNVKKVNLPKSPGNGPRGKKVIFLCFIDHPYLTAYTRGMQKVADAYGIEMKKFVANNDINQQSQQVDQAINERPDLVVITPVDATAVVPLLRKMNNAGIPVIASNLMPIDQGMPYVLTWTGPDDWGQFRMLAHDFADRMHKKGGYCIVRHVPGASPYFSRTFAMITELKKYAPEMTCLDMQPTGLEAEKTMQVVSDWITRYGKELNGIVSADDSGAQIGINEACKNAHREDIIRVAAGNSKVGMDSVKAGTLAAITYQSPEADGAVPMKLAADWFSGKPIDRPVYYLKKQIITKDNVDQYLPPQW
jgi:ribose/xylose/arabinose/galactoside ABC-type transport system permease subunit/ABC-type sugar transport system substrate-binding protein